mmetsp:Transcript_30988/g.90625  ORF Transcript_30988/g.90625 Transcript_30988/m.90625 type:complete len:241 (+) Transcript_30988:96-818(+)
MLPYAVCRAVHILEPAEHLRAALALANLLAVIARIARRGRLGLEPRPDALGIFLLFLGLCFLLLLLHSSFLGSSIGRLLLLLPRPLPALLLRGLVLLLLNIVLRERRGNLGPAIPVAMFFSEGGPRRSEGVADFFVAGHKIRRPVPAINHAGVGAALHQESRHDLGGNLAIFESGSIVQRGLQIYPCPGIDLVNVIVGIGADVGSSILRCIGRLRDGQQIHQMVNIAGNYRLVHGCERDN